MSEEKDKKTEEKTTEEKALEVKVEEKDKEAKKDESSKNTIEGLEELPEDIQKKLEKRKSESTVKDKKGKKKKKKKVAKKVTIGKAYIKATYNNTIVTLADTQGNVLSWASAGIAGFKGPKKSTPYAAQIIARIAVAKAREDYGLSEVSVFVNGVGTGRESAIRALNSNGLIVTLIKDVTPMPHNGCRIRKPRRV